MFGPSHSLLLLLILFDRYPYISVVLFYDGVISDSELDALDGAFGCFSLRPCADFLLTMSCRKLGAGCVLHRCHSGLAGWAAVTSLQPCNMQDRRSAATDQYRKGGIRCSARPTANGVKKEQSRSCGTIVAQATCSFWYT